MNRIDASRPATSFGQLPGPTGIGGWLLLLALGTGIGALVSLVGGMGMLLRILPFEGNRALSTLWEIGPPAAVALILASVGPLVLAAWNGYSLVLLLRRSRRFPKVFITVTAVAIGLAVVTVGLASSVPEFRTRPGTTGMLLRGVLSAGISAAWIVYVRASVRVANTFVED